MLEIIDSAKHLIAVKISGKITAEDIDKAYRAGEQALKDNERVSFFAEVTDEIAFTTEGFLKDLKEGVKQLGNLSKYYRAAVVTDKGWLGALVRVEGLVFSSIDFRVFDPSERDKAFAWASEVPPPLPKPEETAASIHFLQTTNPNVFAYEVNGRVRAKDVKAVVNEFKPYVEKEGKVNVLAKLSDFNGFDVLAMIEDDLVKLKFKSLSKVDKYAVIGPKPWMRNLMELFYPLTSIKLRVFDKDEEAAAWEWVGAQQALLAE
jgi:hypothetical protein